MPEVGIPLTPGSGFNADGFNIGGLPPDNDRVRQAVVLADSAAQAAVAAVLNSTPVGNEYGLVAREASTDVTGVVMPPGGSGVRGWLSGLFQKFLSGSQDNMVASAVSVIGTATWNGASFDRKYGNSQGMLLASAARTATTSSPDQTNFNARGVHVTLHVTAASGTGGLTVQINGKATDGSYYAMTAAPAAVTAPGIYTYALYPGIGAAAPMAQRTSGALPRLWNVTVTHGDGSSYTYAVLSSLIV